MRFLLLVLLTPCLLHAQEQESKLASRLLQPDRTLGFSAQTKTYYGSGGGSVDFSKSANVKEYNYDQKFSSASYEAKAFDVKNFWKGSFLFSTKAADVKTDSALGKTFKTKDAYFKETDEANKSYVTDKGSYTTAAHDYDAAGRGKTSQDHLDALYKGTGKNMTIDEVRDLLNKPRLFN